MAAFVGCNHHETHEDLEGLEEHPTGIEEHEGETQEHPTGTEEGTSGAAEHPTSQAPAEHPTAVAMSVEAEHPAGAETRLEHPVAAETAVEHPEGAETELEHPARLAEATAEHPKPEPEPVTMKELGDAIEDYVLRRARLSGGTFLTYDAGNGQVLSLKLDKVHRERLAHTGPRTYFACTDLKVSLPEGLRDSEAVAGPQGKVYDLDFWVKQTREGLQVTEVMVHKEAGVARYNWVEEDGVWKTVPAG